MKSFIKHLREGIGKYTGSDEPPNARQFSEADRRSSKFGSGALRQMFMFMPHIDTIAQKATAKVSTGWQQQHLEPAVHGIMMQRYRTVNPNTGLDNYTHSYQKTANYIGSVDIHDPNIHGAVKHRVHFVGFEPHEAAPHVGEHAVKFAGWAETGYRTAELGHVQDSPSHEKQYHPDGTVTHHHFISLNNAFTRRYGHGALKETIAHELGHIAQSIDQPKGIYAHSGSSKRGTLLTHGGKDWGDSSHLIPYQHMTDTRRKEISRRDPRLSYLHRGIELNSRMYQQIPRIYDSVKNVVSSGTVPSMINKGHENWKKQEAKFKQGNMDPNKIQLYKLRHFGKLHRELTDFYTSTTPGRTIQVADPYLEPVASEPNQPKIYKHRTKKLIKKQRRNLFLLKHAIAHHHIGEEIKKATGVDVNATAELVQSFSPSHTVRNVISKSNVAERKRKQKEERSKPKPVKKDTVVEPPKEPEPETAVDKRIKPDEISVTPEPTQEPKKQSLGKRILSGVKSMFSRKRQLDETIVKSGSEYCVRSKKGKNLGCSPSRAGAVKRLRQVEYFKHMKEEKEQEWSATVTYIHPEKGEVSEKVTSKDSIRKAVHAFVKNLPKGSEFKKADYDI